ncbi:hypothetical protein H9P43_009923 [Blastocladiella emersonii ATCC 22665]|nr:hypothetical protein H9P43_009923 [Blastocladiella emersonii ATCC 22665]
MPKTTPTKKKTTPATTPKKTPTVVKMPTAKPGDPLERKILGIVREFMDAAKAGEAEGGGSGGGTFEWLEAARIVIARISVDLPADRQPTTKPTSYANTLKRFVERVAERDPVILTNDAGEGASDEVQARLATINENRDFAKKILDELTREDDEEEAAETEGAADQVAAAH